MKATSTPGFRPTLPNQAEGTSAVPMWIPPQIDGIIEPGDNVQVEYIAGSHGTSSGKLYVHVSGITILRLGNISPSQIESIAGYIP